MQISKTQHVTLQLAPGTESIDIPLGVRVLRVHEITWETSRDAVHLSGFWATPGHVSYPGQGMTALTRLPLSIENLLREEAKK